MARLAVSHPRVRLVGDASDFRREDILNDQGELLYEVRQSEFRETSDFMFPHRIEYLDGAGQTLAVETIDAIEVDVQPFDLQQETVAH